MTQVAEVEVTENGKVTKRKVLVDNKMLTPINTKNRIANIKAKSKVLKSLTAEIESATSISDLKKAMLSMVSSDFIK